MLRRDMTVSRRMDGEPRPWGDRRAGRNGGKHPTDPPTEIQETVEFFGSGDQLLFGSRHRPASDPSLGIVICPGLQAEFFRHYRREVLLARGLAASGICVQRFHYRGTGHSDGLSSELTFSRMVEDAVASGEWMRTTEGSEDLVFVGVRLGGLVAAAAAVRLGTPLVLWEPFTRSAIYFRDILRAGRIHEIQKGVTTGRSSQTQLEELRRTGTLDILGYSIDRALFDSLQDQTLEDVLGDHARQVLLVGASPGGVPKNEHARVVAALQSRGFDVETHLVAMAEEAWWFVGGRTLDEEADLAREMTGAISGWARRTAPRERGVR